MVRAIIERVLNVFFTFTQKIALALLFSFIIQLFNYNNLEAQELEPRQLSNIPVGMNYLLLGYGFASGNILLDSSLPIEDLNANLHTGIGAYVRTIDFFGLSGKIDVIVPYANGDWTGLLEGQDTSTARSGLGDPRIRLSFNFSGAPALSLSEFKNYKQETVFGAALQIIAPLGQYDPTKLINLGSNRWTFRPQIGFSRTFDQWLFEAYISAWFFTVNSDFYNKNELRQDPLFAGKVHLIYTFKNKMWLALDAGYGLGGRTFINGEKRETRISTLRLGLDWAVPFAEQHTLKLSYISGVRLERGPDFDALTLIYQYRWGGK